MRSMQETLHLSRIRLLRVVLELLQPGRRLRPAAALQQVVVRAEDLERDVTRKLVAVGTQPNGARDFLRTGEAAVRIEAEELEGGGVVLATDVFPLAEAPHG